jgi:hypothetical protein
LLVDYFVCLFVSWLVSWLVGWLVGWLAECTHAWCAPIPLQSVVGETVEDLSSSHRPTEVIHVFENAGMTPRNPLAYNGRYHVWCTTVKNWQVSCYNPPPPPPLLLSWHLSCSALALLLEAVTPSPLDLVALLSQVCNTQILKQ